MMSRLSGHFPKLLVRLLGPHWAWMLLGGFLGLAALLAAVGLMAVAGWFLSATALAGLSTATALAFNFFFPGIALRMLAIVRTLARYAERIVCHDGTFRILQSLRVWFYRRLEPLAPARLQRFRSGDVLSRIVADIDALDQLYLRVLSPSAVALAAIAALGVGLGLFDPASAAAACGWLLVTGFGLAWILARRSNVFSRQIPAAVAALRISVVDGLQGLADLLIFGARQGRLKAMEIEQRRVISLQQRVSRLSALTSALTALATGLAQASVLYLGAAAVSAGRLPGPYLALILLAVMAAFEAIRPLPAAFQQLGRIRRSAGRLLEVIDTDPPVRFPDRSLRRPSGGGIRFEQVFFAYTPDSPAVFENLNLEVPGGSRASLVGPSGSGKTTLVNLLVRFWQPAAGTIRIGGVPIDELSEKDLRRQVVVVSQQAHVFNTTIRDNLALADPDADDSRLKTALEAARLAEFVGALPRGLETPVGQSGQMLSGGQIRRLAVARAVLRDAPIWILDEPTEGLDRTTEQALIDSLLTLTDGRTVLWITHRPAVLRRMDAVWMLDQRRIIPAQKRTDAVLYR